LNAVRNKIGICDNMPQPWLQGVLRKLQKQEFTFLLVIIVRQTG